MKKKLVGTLFVLGMAALSATGCSSSESTATSAAPAAGENSAAEEANTTEAPASGEDVQVVTFWYNNTGDEAKVYEEAIAAYNASQSKYKVEGLSVTDAQKLIVSMSSNEAPDVIKTGNQSIIQYTKNGLLQSVQEYVDAESFDTSVFSEQSVEANRIDGDVCIAAGCLHNSDVLQQDDFGGNRIH